jgi:hypothetical protein
MASNEPFSHHLEFILFSLSITSWGTYVLCERAMFLAHSPGLDVNSWLAVFHVVLGGTALVYRTMGFILYLTLPYDRGGCVSVSTIVGNIVVLTLYIMGVLLDPVAGMLCGTSDKPILPCLSHV